MAKQFRRVHGKWGQLYVGATLIAEVSAVTYTAAIERLEYNQAGERWTSFHEGSLTGDGEVTVYKAYSDWEGAFNNYLTLTGDQLRALRDAGTPARRPVTIKVQLNDPGSEGAESETLTDVYFWEYRGGFDVGDLLDRTWPFSFEGIVPGDKRIPRHGSLALY